MNLLVENIRTVFTSLPRQTVEILSKDTPHNKDQRREIAQKIAETGNSNAIRKCASILGNTINRLCYAGASQTYALESMVECANALLTLGKASVPSVLYVLDRQRERGIYLYSQRAMLICLEVLENLHDIRAIPNLRQFLSAGTSDMFVKERTKKTLAFLTALESSGLGKYM
jgi:hypothetical protein